MGIYLWLWDENYWAMRGPCSVGFHVPLWTEIDWFISILAWLSITTRDQAITNLHLPPMGCRLSDNAAVDFRDRCYYWSASPYGSSYPDSTKIFVANSSWIHTNNINPRSRALPVRWFKDVYATPTSSWTVVQWTLWGAWVFRNQTDWLISITDWTTGYTIQDKNLWATTVYNYWDTMTEANMWKMYQWWNNYWFPSTWSISSKSSTRVDASSYWPNNYYSSSTFITTSDDNDDWSSVHNDNLWWWVTWVTRFPLPVKHIYIGEDTANI